MAPLLPAVVPRGTPQITNACFTSLYTLPLKFNGMLSWNKRPLTSIRSPRLASPVRIIPCMTHMIPAGPTLKIGILPEV